MYILYAKYVLLVILQIPTIIDATAQGQELGLLVQHY